MLAQIAGIHGGAIVAFEKRQALRQLRVALRAPRSTTIRHNAASLVAERIADNARERTREKILPTSFPPIPAGSPTVYRNADTASADAPVDVFEQVEGALSAIEMHFLALPSPFRDDSRRHLALINITSRARKLGTIADVTRILITFLRTPDLDSKRRDRRYVCTADLCPPVR